MKYRIENVTRYSVNEIAFECDIVASPDRIRVKLTGDRIQIEINPGLEIDFPSGEITRRKTRNYYLRIENNIGDIDISAFFDTVDAFITITTGATVTIQQIIDTIEMYA